MIEVYKNRTEGVICRMGSVILDLIIRMETQPAKNFLFVGTHRENNLFHIRQDKFSLPFTYHLHSHIFSFSLITHPPRLWVVAGCW